MKTPTNSKQNAKTKKYFFAVAPRTQVGDRLNAATSDLNFGAWLAAGRKMYGKTLFDGNWLVAEVSVVEETGGSAFFEDSGEEFPPRGKDSTITHYRVEVVSFFGTVK